MPTKTGEAHSLSSDLARSPDPSPAAESSAVSLEIPEFLSAAIISSEPVDDAECIHSAPIQGIDTCLDEKRLSISSNSEKETVRQHVCDVGADPSHCVETHKEQACDSSTLQHSDTVDHGFQGGDMRPGYGVEPGCGLENANTSHLGISVYGDTEIGRGAEMGKQPDGGEEGHSEYCRVCHLSVEKNPVSSEIISLGCACKDDLALAHRVCAETWFKIKGNRVCEICGSIAQNVFSSRDANSAGQQNEGEENYVARNRAERCWHNQPICNTVLVCVLLVLIASWLFRVTLF